MKRNVGFFDYRREYIPIQDIIKNKVTKVGRRRDKDTDVRVSITKSLKAGRSIDI